MIPIASQILDIAFYLWNKQTNQQKMTKKNKHIPTLTRHYIPNKYSNQVQLSMIERLLMVPSSGLPQSDSAAWPTGMDSSFSALPKAGWISHITKLS